MRIRTFSTVTRMAVPTFATEFSIHLRGLTETFVWGCTMPRTRDRLAAVQALPKALYRKAWPLHSRRVMRMGRSHSIPR